MESNVKPVEPKEATQAQVESLAEVGCEERPTTYHPCYLEDLQVVGNEGLTIN